MALEPLAPIPATQPGSPVKTGKSVLIKVHLQTHSASQKSSFIKSQLYFFMASIVHDCIPTGDAF